MRLNKQTQQNNNPIRKRKQYHLYFTLKACLYSLYIVYVGHAKIIVIITTQAYSCMNWIN